MRHWKQILTSSVFRLIVIVMAAIIPLNSLTLILGNRVLRDAGEQVAQEAKNSLRLYLNQIDSELTRVNTTMALIALDDPDFLRLAGREVTDEKEHYRQVQALTGLQQTFKDRLEENKMLAGFFAWFPEKDYFAAGTRYGSRAVRVREAIEAAAREGRTERFRDGAVLLVEDRPVLVTMQTRRGILCGGWIELTDMAEWISLSEKRLAGFADRSGALLYANSAFPESAIEDEARLRLNDADCLIISVPAEKADLRLLEALPIAEITGSLPEIIQVLQILSIAALLVLPIILLAMQHRIVSPVRKLRDAMDRIELGEVDYRIPVGRRDGSEFDAINRNFNRTLDELRDLKISFYEEQLKAQKIRMGFLAQQIQPHFILNTLNILYSYEKEEYDLIQRMILLLSRYFRYVVNANAETVALGRELDHIRNYFEIQRARFPHTFRASVDCGEGLERCLIPPLLIQNLAENAIKHAFTPGETIDITVSAFRREDGRLGIQIQDTGAGISDEVLERIEEFRRTREFRRDLGVGIQNSIDRLSLLYGDAGELRIHRVQPHGTCIELALPLRMAEEEALW